MTDDGNREIDDLTYPTGVVGRTESADSSPLIGLLLGTIGRGFNDNS